MKIRISREEIVKNKGKLKLLKELKKYKITENQNICISNLLLDAKNINESEGK